MSKILRNTLVITITIFVLIGGYYLIAVLGFAGVFDKKYSRDELTANFKTHEKEFEDLYTYFIGNVSKDTTYQVYFGLGRFNSINLSLYTIVIDPKNKIISGENLFVDTPKMASILAVLGWTKQTALDLRDKLAKTNCDWILTGEKNDSTVSLAPNQSGWGSYTFVILNKPKDDSVIKYMGKPITNTGFGRQV